LIEFNSFWFFTFSFLDFFFLLFLTISFPMICFLAANIHYGKTLRCRATDRTAKTLFCPAKALPCVDARQRLHGNTSDGNEDIVVHMTKLHGKGLCRACATLPCGRCFAVRGIFAVHFAWPHGKGRPTATFQSFAEHIFFAVRRLLALSSWLLCRALLRDFAVSLDVAVRH
jgi:hypothetical protein